MALAATPALGLAKPKPTFEITPSPVVKGVFIKKPLEDAFIPEEWARESLAILTENMVIAKLVHRDRRNV